MNYIIFFSNANHFYCYAENGKIYKGENKNFKPGLKFFLAPILTRALLTPLTEYLQPLLDNELCFGMIFIGIIVAIFISIPAKTKLKKAEADLLTEIFLTKEQFETYISEGKKLFKKQFWIIYICVLLTISFFSIFLIFHSFSLYFFGIVLTLLTMLLLYTITPLKKYRFFKNFSKDNR